MQDVRPSDFLANPSVYFKPVVIEVKSGAGAACSADNATLRIDTAASNLTADGMLANAGTDPDDDTNLVLKLVDGDASDRLINLRNAADPSLTRAGGANFTFNFKALYHKPDTVADDAISEGDFSAVLAFDVDNH